MKGRLNLGIAAVGFRTIYDSIALNLLITNMPCEGAGCIGAPHPTIGGVSVRSRHGRISLIMYSHWREYIMWRKEEEGCEGEGW